MFLVFFMAAALWVLGMIMGVSRTARLSTVGMVFGVVLILQLALPDGHPIREATGQSPALWLMVAGAFVMVLVYGQGLKALRKRANKKEPEMPSKTGTFSETELDRYARHIVLRELGGVGQKRLKLAKVLVIGAGGLGAPALQYLAAAGVGTIGVIDDDEVENANLQRQVIHRDADIGMPKVFSAKQAMEAQNPNVIVQPYHRRLTDDIAMELFADYDLILDGTDNFETRYLVNKAAVETGKPLISGALSQWEGQLSLFEPAKGAPCYQCIFPEAPAAGLAPSCSEAGVVGPLPGVVGAMMAVEAVKVITGAGMSLRGEMLIYDALYGESRKITLSKRADCPTCGTVAG